MTNTIYIAPDIRKQTLEEAQDFLEAKRAARMTQAYTYQEKQLDRALVLEGKEQARYQKALEAFNKGKETVDKAIETQQRRLEKLISLHTNLVNIETEIKTHE